MCYCRPAHVPMARPTPGVPAAQCSKMSYRPRRPGRCAIAFCGSGVLRRPLPRPRPRPRPDAGLLFLLGPRELQFGIERLLTHLRRSIVRRTRSRSLARILARCARVRLSATRAARCGPTRHRPLPSTARPMTPSRLLKPRRPPRLHPRNFLHQLLFRSIVPAGRALVDRSRPRAPVRTTRTAATRATMTFTSKKYIRSSRIFP